jgi:hypothetical protein
MNVPSFGRTALAYATRGQRVLPLRECGKEPLVRRGVHDATCHAGTIADWWRRLPRANVGIAVSPEWWVLDVDPRNGGDVELDRLERTHSALPPTVHAATGSGGRHILFARPNGVRLRGKIGPGLDVLGAGRYIVAAPSIHPSGGAYRWISTPGTKIVRAPTWLEKLVTAAEPPPSASAPLPPTTSPSRIERARKYLAACPPAISGSGGHVLTFTLAQRLVRGFLLDEATAFALLTEWNRTCQPPWSARELAHKIKEAARSGRMAPGCLADNPRDGRAA